MEVTISIGLLVLIGLGISRCSETGYLEKQIREEKPFKLYSKEFVCSRTEKQLKIDELEQQIQQLKD